MGFALLPEGWRIGIETAKGAYQFGIGLALPL
jgi:hypothetical protein